MPRSLSSTTAEAPHHDRKAAECSLNGRDYVPSALTDSLEHFVFQLAMGPRASQDGVVGCTFESLEFGRDRMVYSALDHV